MAKQSVDQWSTTPAENTDIDSIDIDERALARGWNNAVRALMAQVKAKFDSIVTTISGLLTAANNLSDLDDASTARTNLGLGTIATEAAADYTTVADLASTSNGEGASLVGVEDAGGLITATTVEGALQENRTAIDAIEADYLASTAIGSTVQAYSANLDEYAGVNPTAAGLALLDDTDADAQLATLGGSASGIEAFKGLETCVFRDSDYIDETQIAYIRNHDTASQDEATVTSGIRAQMDAAMAFVAGGSGRVARIHNVGTYAMSDEIFSETFAQNLWDTNFDKFSQFIFNWWGARFQVKNWSAHAAERTSGTWDEQSISDVVPTALFRWEQKTTKGTGPIILGGMLIGELTENDPIGLKLRYPNRGYFEGLECHNFANIGRMIEIPINSDFHSNVVQACGFQPTQSGGNGFASSTARVSLVAGSGTTAVTADEAIFVSDHVGKWFCVAGAGSGNTEFWAQINSIGGGGTTAVLNRECATDVTDATFSFRALTGSITAASNTLTLDTELTLDMVGRYVFVWKAGSESNTDFDILATRVTAQVGKVLTLATNARNTVTSAIVAVAPSSFIGKTDDAKVGGVPISGHLNDCQFFGDRVERSTQAGWGGAITAIEQDNLLSATFGSKTHGGSSSINNFAGNCSAVWWDNTKEKTAYGMQNSWGSYDPLMAIVCVSGERTLLKLPDVAMFMSSDYSAFFLIDPKTNSLTDTRVLVSGFDNTGFGAADRPNQDYVRYGAQGVIGMLGGSGPWHDRRGGDYSSGVPMHLGNVEILGETDSYFSFLDLADSKGFQLLQDGEGFHILYDDDGDRTYDAGGFGWTATNGLEYDKDGTGMEGVFDEGTFTPTVEIGGTEIVAGGGSYAVQVGEYRRVLDQLYVRVSITLSSIASLTGTVDIVLPSALEASNSDEVLMFGDYASMSGLTGTPFAVTIAGSSKLRLSRAGAASRVALSESNLSNSSRFEFSGTFLI